MFKKTDSIDEKEFTENLQQAVEKLKVDYPFISVSPTSVDDEYRINIPVEKRAGHESHFKYVAESFFGFLANRNMPEWEVSNTLAKYYITTKAVEVAKERY